MMVVVVVVVMIKNSGIICLTAKMIAVTGRH
jgi:hypothetical protein